jgi:ATP-binding cassette subfamily B protein
VCDAADCAVPLLTAVVINALAKLQKEGAMGAVWNVFDLNRFTPVHAAVLFAGALVMTQVIRAVFSFLQRTYFFRSARYVENDLRVDFFAHLQKLSPSYYDRIKTGDLMALSINDVGTVRQVMGIGLMGFFDPIYMVTYSLIILLTQVGSISLYALAPLVILPFLVRIFSGPIHRRFEKIQAQFGTMSIACQENFSGIRVVKAFVREDYEKGRFREMNADYARKNVALAKLRAMYQPLLAALGGVSIGIAFWLGGREVIAGRLDVGQLWMLYSYTAQLIWPMVAIGWVMVMFQQADTSMGRINKVFDVQPTIKDTPESKPLDEIRGEIELRNLTFTYPGSERPALVDVNLKIPAGSTLALVGPAGSGKSTLVKLIGHLYEVGENQLFIDGHDVTKIPLEQLRDAIGFVPQETFLFSESIHDNIAYGRPDVEREMVVQAAQIAAIHGEVEPLQEGYSQMLGERGINLSGGQKQRVTIARAVIKDPRILILDDALSSVDTGTEERLLSDLGGVMKKRTNIMIAHRISTVRNADNIVVLQDGRITEQGTHEELLRLGGFYAETYRRQQLEESLRTM